MTGTTTGNSVSNVGNIHNTVLLQGGGCFTPQFGNPEMMPGSGGYWYWPGSSVVSGNEMLVFAYKLAPDPNKAPPYDWRVVGTSVARYAPPVFPSPEWPGSNADDQLPARRRRDPVGHPVLPQSRRWQGVSLRDHEVLRWSVPGSRRLAGTGFVREPTTLEYFTNPPAVTPATPAWSNSFNNAKPMSFTKNATPEGSPLAQLSVVPYNGGYLAGAMIWDTFSVDVGAWFAEKPEGPWRNLGVAATAARQNSDQLVYDARIADLRGGVGWTVVYNVNDPNTDHQRQNFTLYRGDFAPTQRVGVAGQRERVLKRF